MPWFIVNTNVAQSAVPAALLTEATQNLAKAMGKPASMIAVIINADKMMTFGGTPDPAAVCSLTSIGKLSLDENKGYVKLICGMVNKHLGISTERIYVNFEDVRGTNVGWNNQTFEHL